MKQRFFAALGVAVAVLFLGSAPLVHADVNDFTVTSFTADDTLSRSDPQGELHIIEHISVDFSDFNHGILRALPNTYKNHRLQLQVNSVSSTSGAPAEFTTYKQNDNTVLKIGNPSRTVTGNQEYTIDYTVRNVITFYSGHDELFWDINGDQWLQRFGRVSVMLHLPEGVHQSRSPVCYAGNFGDTRSENCAVTPGEPATTITAHTRAPLSSYQTLSIVAGFDQGFFHPSHWYETVGEYGADIGVFLVPIVLLGGLTGLSWFRHGRDPKGRGVIVPEYGPPKGLSPIEVGTLIDFRTDNKDITATIVDLAIRRYITIVEQTQDRKLRRDVTTYTLRSEITDYSQLSAFEKAILNDLFTGSGKGEELDLAAMKFKLSKTATLLRATVRKHLVKQLYIRPSSITGKNVLVGVGAVLAVCIDGAVGGHYGAEPAFGLGVFLGAVLAAIFLARMSSRTPKGVQAKEQILGLKMYLEVAESERIKKLQSPDAAYAPKSAEPKHTVELFEKLLPYAMILGVEQQWAKKFENIYRTPPDWYSGNWNTFSLLYLTSSLSSGIGQQVNSAFSAPSSSSGSGFSGGGAGGGGGGGGGGGW
jgi:uncharacterized membrane protein YgcG